jgi:hypothetical protein
LRQTSERIKIIKMNFSDVMIVRKKARVEDELLVIIFFPPNIKLDERERIQPR